MPGRVYQIDAGWMGGAASTGYGGPFFKPSSGDAGLDGHWCYRPIEGFNVFLKMLTRCVAWRIFPQNSKRLAAQKKLLTRPTVGSASDSGHPDTTGNISKGKIHHG